MSLARHYLVAKRTRHGYGLDISEVFHQDLDRAIVLKNASVLQSFYFGYLAKASLEADARNPSLQRDLLAALLRETDGYSIADYKDIFYFQAPDASDKYIDEEIFSLYRTLKEQKAAVDQVAGPGDTSLTERHRRLKFILGALAFGADIAGKEIETPLPPSFDEVRRAVTGWALKQGLMRTVLFGEHLAHEYTLCL